MSNPNRPPHSPANSPAVPEKDEELPPPNPPAFDHAIELLKTQPPRGILKHSSSLPKRYSHVSSSSDDGATEDHPTQMDAEQRRSFRFDEMNLIETNHPVDKTYGFQKVDEPPTPYNRRSITDDDEEDDSHGGSESKTHELLDSDALTKQLNLVAPCPTKRRSSSPADVAITENDWDQERRKKFEKMRNEHYNEFKVAKQLKQQGLLSDCEDIDDSPSNVDPNSKKPDHTDL